MTQASSAIPVVPLYVSLLYRIMKDNGNHEDCIHHIDRLFREQLYGDGPERLDEVGRIRMDDRELDPPIQDLLKSRWAEVTTDNIATLGDLEGYRADFLRIFGFGMPGVDYQRDVDPTLGRG